MSFPIVLLAAVSCLPYYFKYEKKKPQTREHVVLAVMTALTVISRMIFAPVPGFKPVAAMTAVCGMAFGRESGFLCGSLSAFISNFFFGQGPWTPFQMLSWGIIGFIAGIAAPLLKRGRLPLCVYGALSGVAFSLIMDIYTVIWQEQTGINIERYLFYVASSLPVMIIYSVTNVAFLLLLAGPVGRRLSRITVKYGIGERKYEAD